MDCFPYTSGQDGTLFLHLSVIIRKELMGAAVPLANLEIRTTKFIMQKSLFFFALDNLTLIRFSTSTFLTEYEIQDAIFNDGSLFHFKCLSNNPSGPVEGTMSVYDDFMSYSSGVYVASPNANYLGGHVMV
jgi:hypothetical protein